MAGNKKNMSLIHDALKKAQAPSGTSGKTEFPQFLQDSPGDKEKSKKTRIIVFAVILVGAMIYMGYDKFFAGKKGAPKPAGSVGAVASDDTSARQDEAKHLKDEAMKSFQQNNLDDAWIRLSTAGQLNPLDADIWNNMGLISKRKGDVVKAREFYEKSLQMKPDCVECLNNLAVLDMDEGNPTKAKERLTKAMSLDSNYADAAFHMAVIEEELGDVRLAVAYYKKFVELKRNAPQKLIDDVRRHVDDMESE